MMKLCLTVKMFEKDIREGWGQRLGNKSLDGEFEAVQQNVKDPACSPFQTFHP